jgi:hypothetical protein
VTPRLLRVRVELIERLARGGLGRRRIGMRMPSISGRVAASAIALLASAAQAPSTTEREALADLMVWGTATDIDPGVYPSALQVAVERYLRQATAYRSQRPRPPRSPESGMLHDARVSYERRLVAASADPNAQGVAVAYVDGLSPCYEWEGFHECPEREATFAEQYQAAHPGAFGQYLPLLAAHRWLCTAEAYEYEKRPEEVARSRRAYEQAVLTASKSTDVLIRTAADGLRARGRCHSRQ